MNEQICMRELTMQEAESTEGGSILVAMAVSYCIGMALGVGIRIYAAS